MASVETKDNVSRKCKKTDEDVTKLFDNIKMGDDKDAPPFTS